MTSGYRLLTYIDAGKPRAGVLAGERIVPAASLLKGVNVDATSVLGLLRVWDQVHPRLRDATQNLKTDDGISLAQAKLDAPILYPGALFCAGANYWDHLEEMAEIAKRVTGKAPSMTKGKDPYFFMKPTAGSITYWHAAAAARNKGLGGVRRGDCAPNPNISRKRRSMRSPAI